MNDDDTPTLEYTVEGPPDAPVVVFLHGWPDDASMWRHQVEAVSAEYRCVLPTWPNFGDTAHEIGGMDFPELVRRLHKTIDTFGDDPVVLVTHDWGAYIGYLYEQSHPERVQTMIAMDVGGHVQPSSIRDAAIFVGYQWTLVTLWLVGGVIPPLGTALTRAFARMLKVPERQCATLRSRCNYPYFYFWRSTLVPWLRSRLIGRYRPQSPVLYLYGGRKPLMFHTDRWLDIVEKTGGRNECIEDAAHWFMEDRPDATNALVTAWLAGMSAERS